METALKQLIKEAILEALVEFTNGGVATLSTGDPTAPVQAPAVDDPKGSEAGTTTNGDNDSGKGGGSESSSGGGTGPGGKPKPDVGVGAFGLR